MRLALGNCRVCDNHMPKRPFIENKVDDYRTPKLNMAFAILGAWNRMPFMARTCTLCYDHEFTFLKSG